MTVPNPAAVLKEALRSVPELKWGLGVGGLFAIVAIVTMGWKLDPLIAAAGAIVLLILMTALVIFAKLSATAGLEFKYAIQTLMWASLCLTIAAAVFLFTSVFFQWPLILSASQTVNGGLRYKATESDKRIWELEEQGNDLRGSWETVEEYGDGKRNEVLERATKLWQALQAIDDKDLGPSGHVIKREYSCYALIMVADTESARPKKAAFAHQALDQCKSASADLRLIAESKSRDSNLDYTAAWAAKQDQRPFVEYLTALAMCLEATATSNKQLMTDVERAVDSIPTYYLNRYPPKKDLILKQCLDKTGDSQNDKPSDSGNR